MKRTVNFDSSNLTIYTSIGCACKAHAASGSEKINIDFMCEIVNFGSPNLIILKKNLRIQQNITIFSQYFHF